MANENMIKFLRGNVASLPQTATAGALYFTKDEGIYMGMEDGSYHRYGDFITVADVKSLPASGAHATCMYYCTSENILARYDSVKGWIQINKQPTAEEMKVLLGLGTLAYKSEVAENDLSAELKEKVNAAAEGNHSHSNKAVLDGITAEKVAAWDSAEGDAIAHADAEIAKDRERLVALEAIDHEHANKALLDTYTQTEANLADAVAKKHSHANADELAKFVDGDKAKYDAVVADHLTSADKTTLENAIKEAKKAGTDANTNIESYKVTNDARVLAVEEDIAEINGENGILAQAKSYSDGKLATARTEISSEIDADVKVVADDLAGYKTSNDAALAGVKATAEAAATKTYTDTELAKKVDKVDGKDLIATSEIARLATLANYDDTQVKADIAKKADAEAMTTELGKKVDKVEGKDLIATSEIERLATLKNYDDTALAGRVTTAEGKIAALETASATHATKDEAKGYADAKDEAIGAAQKAADDLAAYVGTFTASEGVDTIVKYIDAKTANIASDERVNAIDDRVKAIEEDYLVEADIANFETKENVKKVADDLAAYVESNDQALAGVKATAEAARTEEEVNSQIDTKIAALNLGTTYEPIGAETRAKAYADGLISDANLAQYTTEQEVKDIVDGVIAGAVDGDTITGLANLVEYLNTHGTEAKEMGAAIDVLEGDVKGLKEAPSAGIKATDIAAWNGEIGAKALAETKLDASTFTEYSNAHAGDYTNKQIDDAIDADVQAAINAEVLRANGAYDAKGDAAAAQAAAEAAAKGYTDAEVAKDRARLGILEAIDHDAYIAADTALKTELQKEIDDDVKALADTVYTKSETFTKDEINDLLTWGSF